MPTYENYTTEGNLDKAGVLADIQTDIDRFSGVWKKTAQAAYDRVSGTANYNPYNWNAPTTPTPAQPAANSGKYIVQVIVDANGNYIYVWSDGTTTNSGINNGSQQAKKDAAQSAWTILYNEFSRYGLGTLAESIKGLIEKGVSGAEMLLELRNRPEYQTRFAANNARIANGLRALSEAEYIGLEDAYANLMRKYGLPDWYTAQGQFGTQTNLQKFIANDVSPAEMEDRIQLAVNRLQNGPKEVMDTLRNFFPNITNGDMLAYILDPKKALPVLQRQVTMAEIGGEATRYGLDTSLQRADELAGLGVTQAQARQGYQAIGGGLERGRQLSGFFNEPEYNQNTAENEIFGAAGAMEAATRRKRLIRQESSAFGGSSGVRGGALDANRAGSF